MARIAQPGRSQPGRNTGSISTVSRSSDRHIGKLRVVVITGSNSERSVSNRFDVTITVRRDGETVYDGPREIGDGFPLADDEGVDCLGDQAPTGS